MEVAELVEEVGGGGEEGDEVVWVGAKGCVEFWVVSGTRLRSGKKGTIELLEGQKERIKKIK